MQLWVIASEYGGKVPSSLDELRYRLRDITISQEMVNLLIEKGFLIGCKQVLASESKCLSEERRGEAETETEKIHTKVCICPHKKIIDIYHLKCPSLPQVQSVSNGLQKTLKARWREDFQRQNLKWWEWYFENVNKSDFLTGKSKEWTASFGWLIGPKNMTKVLNGQYLNRGSKTDRAIEEFLDE